MRAQPAVAIALALLVGALPGPAPAACKVGSMEMPVRMIGTRAVATVGIDGTDVPLTVDSGAFFSVLTGAAAEQLQLRTRSAGNLRVEGVTGRMDARLTTVDKLKLLKGEIERVDFVVGTNEPGAGTMGLMGRNILWFTDTEYDLAHGAVRFSFPDDGCARANMAYWAGTTPVTEVDLEPAYRSREKAPEIRVRVKLNGVELIAELDTGAGTLVTLQAAQRAGVAESAMTPFGRITGVGRGTARAWSAPFERFQIGGETILNNRLRVGDIRLEKADLLLGIDFFLSHRLYLSKQQSKLFMTYNGGTVFALNRSEETGAVPLEPGVAASDASGLTADQLFRRGAASAARLDFARALVDLNRAVELEPGSAEFRTQRGVIEEALKQPAEALADFDQALELDPGRAEARWRRAGLRLAARDRNGARDDLDRLDRTLAPQAQLRLAMARAYFELELPGPALDQLDRWLAAHPTEVGREAALNSRCWARLLVGVDPKQALDDCNDAVDAQPKNPSYLDSRGWVRLRLGRPREALADFERSIAVRPQSALTLYGRGSARLRLGDAVQGEADLEAARRLQPDIDDRVKRLGLLAEGPAKP